MLQQSICSAGFSKQIPRWRRRCNRERDGQKLSEQLYLIFLIIVFLFFLNISFLLMPLHCFQSIVSIQYIFCCIIMWGLFGSTQYQCSEHRGLDRCSICTVLSLLIPPLWALVYFALVLHESFPQKSSSRVEATETAGPSICVYAWSINPPWTLLHNCWQRASHVWVLLALWCIFILELYISISLVPTRRVQGTKYQEVTSI